MRSNEDPKAGDRTVLVWHRSSPIRVAKRFWRGRETIVGLYLRGFPRGGADLGRGGVDCLLSPASVERDIIASV